MAADAVEILIAHRASASARPMLNAIHAAAEADGSRVLLTERYHGHSPWLVLFGVGAAAHDRARRQHVKAGGRVLLFDLGYFGREKITGYLRMSINDDHPQRWLDRTQPDPARWGVHQLALREDADPAGPIILVGLGRKSRSYLCCPDWEARKLEQLRRRFPGRQVIHRPKGKDFPVLQCERNTKSPIADLLKGASLVVCRHSNVAVDATVAGVPFEAEDGAAMWLAGRDFTYGNRLDFLRRLSWWQWKATEASQAWAFAKRIAQCD